MLTKLRSMEGTNPRRSQRMRLPFLFILTFSLGFSVCFCMMSTMSSAVVSVPDETHQFFQFDGECALPRTNHDAIPTILLNVYNDTSPYLNFPPPHVAPLLQHNHTQGSGSTNSVFRELIEAVRPNTIVEVGSFLGASTLHMAVLTRALGLDQTAIIALDDFRGWPGFRATNGGLFEGIEDVNGDIVIMQQFMLNVLDAGEEGRVLPLPFSTAAGLDALCQWGVYADIIKVDADNTFQAVWEDVNRGWKILRPGGVMFGHDYSYDINDYGVKRAVDLFAKVNRLVVKPNDEHWIIHKPSSSSSSSHPKFGFP